MKCAAARSLFSEHLDSAPDSAPDSTLGHTPGTDEVAAVTAHLRRCPSCRRLHAGVAALVMELPHLGVEAPIPENLSARLLARVRLPRRLPVHGHRQVQAMEWRRLAAWAIVFIGAAWQLGGGAVASRAMQRAAPLLADAREEIARTSLRTDLDPLGRSDETLSALGRWVQDRWVQSRVLDATEPDPPANPAGEAAPTGDSADLAPEMP